MIKRSLLFVSLFLLIAAGVVVAAGQQEADTSDQKYGGYEGISVGASSVGSSSYSKLTIWSGHVGQKLDVDIIPEGTAGSVANVSLTQAGETEMGSTMTNLAYEAWEGVGNYEGTKHTNIRAVVTLDAFALQFYALEDSGIKSIYDLDGKRVNLSRAGSGTDTWARRVFDMIGIEPNIVNVSPGEGNDMMRDGVLDAAGCMGSAHPSIIEMNATHELNIFGTGDATDEFLQAHEDLFKLTMDEIYEDQKAPYVTFGEMNVLIAHKDLPEDLVYDITKTTFEDKAKMAAGYPGFGSIKPEDIFLNLVPLHKGAYKYYQEIGVDIPAEIQPVD
jgi:TRAP transporter TAXI family solute receptor